MKCPKHNVWLAQCGCVLDGKGEEGKRCNCQGCQEVGAHWFNRVTRAWYCQTCAQRINESSFPHESEPLCSKSKSYVTANGEQYK